MNRVFITISITLLLVSSAELKDYSRYPIKLCGNLVERQARRETSIQQAPYLTRIEYVDRTYKNGIAKSTGGIIIDEYLVLTRASICEVSRAREIYVYAGHSYVDPPPNPQPVIEYEIHKDRRNKYSRQTWDEHANAANYKHFYPMDFCLLRLAKPLIFSDTIQKAALPSPNEPLQNQTFFLPGWGDYMNIKRIQGWCTCSYDTQKVEPHLATLFYHMGSRFPDDQCQARWKQVPNGGDWKPEYFCLGFLCPDFRTAIGDEGGPVFCPQTQKVVGMISYVSSWEGNESPALNLKMSYATEWINELRNNWKRSIDNATR